MFFPHRVDDEIVLTLFSPPDAEEFYALVDQNREHLGRWFTWVNRYESISDSIDFATGNLQRMAEMSAMGCLIWYRGHLAGWVVRNVSSILRHLLREIKEVFPALHPVFLVC